MICISKKCIIDIESTGLLPWESELICIGIRGCNEDDNIKIFHGEEESILKNFMDYYKRKNYTEIIGYNLSFDFRFIFAKCLQYNIKCKSFFNSSLTDLMKIMKSGRNFYGSTNRPGKLDEWVVFLFKDGKIPLPDRIHKLFEQGRIDEIIRYNKKDVQITYQLYKRVREVLELEM